ncbi:MAG TPA: cupin domain-containing protein [Gaiellaceae bacterium]|jgi:quercetin dioxygenase-like cupin family protein
MKSKLILTLAVVVFGVAVYVGNVLATPAGGQSTTILAKATVGNLSLFGRSFASPTPGGKPQLWLAALQTFGQSDVYVVDNTFIPGGTTGWHSHPGPSLVFVVAGTITNYSSDDPTCSPHVYTAGQSFVDSGGNDEHMLRNETGANAETIAVQFVPAGATRRIDEPEPSNCHV